MNNWLVWKDKSRPVSALTGQQKRWRQNLSSRADAELFIEAFSEKVTQVSKGIVETKSKADNLKRFKSYFESYAFEKWEDVAPPTISLSEDGTMATIVVQKRALYVDEQSKL